jgi:hypothetical protein
VCALVVVCVRALKLAAATVAFLLLAPTARADCVGALCPRFATTVGEDRAFPRASALDSATGTVVIAGLESYVADGVRRYAGLLVAEDAASGAILLQRRFDELGPAYLADVALSPDGTTAFVTGMLGYGTDDASRQLTAAFDLTSGDLLWWRATEPSGYFLDGGDHVLVSSDGRVVYSVGTTTPPTDDPWSQEMDLRLIAYDASDGAELWRVRHRGDWQQEHIFDAMLSQDGASLIVAGVRLFSGCVESKWYVDVIDTRTGTRRWRDLWEAPNAAAEAAGLSSNGSTLYVSGQWEDVYGRVDDGRDWRARTVAYDMATGDRRWTRSIVRRGVWIDVADMAVRANGPCIAGPAFGGEVSSEAKWANWIACMDRRGILSWIHVPPLVGYMGIGVQADGVELDAGGGSVVMSAVERTSVAADSTSDVVTKSFDATSGAREWRAAFEGSGGEYLPTQPVGVFARSGDALVIGQLRSGQRWQFLTLGYGT